MGLDIVEMVIDVEAEFGVELPDAELATARTVAEFYRVLVGHLPARQRPLSAVCRGPTWERFLDVVAESTCRKREDFAPEVDLYRDLRLGG